jgi:argininosuccinate lyase
MEKIWAGVTSGQTDSAADSFNSSAAFDRRMYRQDILGSVAHARMLGDRGIITAGEAEILESGLTEILAELESGALAVDTSCEDIHSFVERELTARTGDVGRKLHTARSRNDQVAQDLRLYLIGEIDSVSGLLGELVAAVTDRAEEHKADIMPGYTHLQRAQPVTFGHSLMAYAFMFLRDMDRLAGCRARTNVSPIGSCALAGTTYGTDRRSEAAGLGFDGVCENSIDGVSDRDFCVELAAALSIVMMHLSRFSEELILWSSWEFRFIKLSDAYTTGSSIMPQKKNPDMAELCRGKTGRVYGDLMALLTVMKGLPLAYNKDMQEDKEAVFDACDTVRACLAVLAPMIRTMQTDRARMLAACREGFINATDLADYLTRKGMPFRDAYKLTGQIVDLCERKGVTLEELPLEEYRALCPLFSEDLYPAIDMETCVALRTSFGGTSKASVEKQIEEALKALK